MGDFFVYILKSAVCLLLFYPFFKLLLSKETFHRFNRVVVLSIFLISLLLPFSNITFEKATQVNEAVLSLEQFINFTFLTESGADIQQAEIALSWVHVLVVLYFIGVLFFLARNIYSYIQLYRMLRKGKRIKLDNGTILINHHIENLAPFSWMNYIIIYGNDLEENGKEIITHELAHINNRHSFDLILADILIIFQWFNPVIWLLKRELQDIHEYEADEEVINCGIDAKKYQLLLIKKAVGTRLYSMANSFNHSKLKKRITMMLKEKSSPWARLKYLYVLPLAAIAVTAFARPEISNELKEISSVKVNDFIEIPEKESEKNTEVSREPVVEEDIHLINDDELFIEDVLPNNSTIDLEERLMTPIINDFEEKTSETLPTISFSKENIEPDSVIVDDILKIVNDHSSFHVIGVKSSDFDIMDEEKKPLIIVDGVEISSEDLSSINPESIKSISVLKDQRAKDLYGEKAKNGVVLITIKSKPLTFKTKSHRIEMNNMYLNGDIISVNLDPIDKILFILDGKEVNTEDIDQSKIKSINVIKDISKATEEEKKIIEKFGDKGKNGVIIATSDDSPYWIKD